MAKTFFPDPAFAWVYCLGLCLLTGVAAWTDTRTAKIPNRLNLVILATGVLINVIRAAWLAGQDRPLWAFDTGAAWLGAIDGLLFALAGFLVAFAVMFACWIFGLCGGGDVKLLAAVGAWAGLDLNLLRIWLASFVVLVFWFAARVVGQAFSPRQLKKTMAALKDAEKARGAKTSAGGKLRVTYSLPIAVATAVVLLWVFRFELLLVPPPP